MDLETPLQRRRLDLRSGTVEVRFQLGEKSAVVLIHGNSTNQTVFDLLVVALRREGYGVVTLDLPGHGASDKATEPSQTYSFPGYAAVVRQVVDDLAIDRYRIAGWSLGGHVGLELMGTDPRVLSLCIWGTPPAKPSLEALHQAFLPSPSMNYAGQAVLEPADCIAYAEAMLGPAVVTEDLIEAIRVTDGAARAFMVQNGVAGIGLDARDLVERDPRPLAVLHGADDPFVNLAYLRSLSYRNLWRDDIHVLPSVGHAAHLQVPGLFNSFLLSFLTSSSCASQECSTQ